MLRIICIGIILNFAALNAMSNEFDIRFSGFSTLAMTHNTNSDVELRSNFLNDSHSGWSAKNDSNLGGQVNISVTSNWDAVAQIVLQDRVVQEFDSYLELAFVRYRPNRNWALRAGRINSDLYLLSEYPSVGYAYVWVRPPNEFYSFAGIAAHLDGVDAEYSRNFGDGFLRVKLAYGSTRPKADDEGREFSFRLSNLVTLSSSYQLGNWLIRGSHSRAKFTGLNSSSLNGLLSVLSAIPSAFWPDVTIINQNLTPEGKPLVFNALGASYDDGKWLLHSELGSAKSDWLIYPPAITAYLSGGYIVDNTTYFASIARVKNRKKFVDFQSPELPSDTPDSLSTSINNLHEAVLDLLNGVSARQTTFSVGAKYFLGDNMALKIQADYTDISPKGGGLWEIDDSVVEVTRQKVTTLSLSLSMVF